MLLFLLQGKKELLFEAGGVDKSFSFFENALLIITYYSRCLSMFRFLNSSQLAFNPTTAFFIASRFLKMYVVFLAIGDEDVVIVSFDEACHVILGLSGCE